jgi:hypothetical protein
MSLAMFGLGKDINIYTKILMFLFSMFEPIFFSILENMTFGY